MIRWELIFSDDIALISYTEQILQKHGNIPGRFKENTHENEYT